jgi:predicted MFS family arabinose efflux permease
MIPFILILFLINLLDLFENILMEYVLVKVTKQKNDQSDDQVPNNELPYFFGFRAVGNVLGTFFGGRIIEQFGNRFSFKVALMAPVSLFFFLFLYDEQPIHPSTKPVKDFRRDWNLVKALLSKYLFS